jgi:hypothetical protein
MLVPRSSLTKSTASLTFLPVKLEKIARSRVVLFDSSFVKGDLFFKISCNSSLTVERTASLSHMLK